MFPLQSEPEVKRLEGPPRGFKGRVVSSRPLTPTTCAIEVEKPNAFRFRPTQFTFLQLRTEDGMDARPMSLATSPTRPHLEYAIRVSDSPYKRAFAALQPDAAVPPPVPVAPASAPAAGAATTLPAGDEK